MGFGEGGGEVRGLQVAYGFGFGSEAGTVGLLLKGGDEG